MNFKVGDVIRVIKLIYGPAGPGWEEEKKYEKAIGRVGIIEDIRNCGGPFRLNVKLDSARDEYNFRSEEVELVPEGEATLWRLRLG